MKTKSFTQQIFFKAKPNDVYNILMDSKSHSELIGGEARIGANAGDTFFAYDGYIEGKNIELIPRKKIVQTWRTTDEGWPENYYSTIEFVFKETEDGTQLDFTHSNIPVTVKADYEQGWKDYYWEPMKALLEK